MIKQYPFPSDLTFFGLNNNSNFIAQARKSLFTQIHNIVFWGNGGYDWHTVYNMPIWLRKFTFYLLKEHYKEKTPDESNVIIDENGGNMNPETINKIPKPVLNPKIKPGPSAKKPISYK